MYLSTIGEVLWVCDDDLANTDELDTGGPDLRAHARVAQRIPFRIPVVTPPIPASDLGVALSGMCDELGDAFDAIEQGEEGRRGDAARVHHADGAVVRAQRRPGQARARPFRKSSERPHREPPRETCRSRLRVMRQADVRDAELRRDAHDDVEDVGQDVQVLVRIHVAYLEAGVGDARELPPRLARDVGAVDTAAEVALHERAVAREERAVVAEERAHLTARRERALADEREMCADVEPADAAQGARRGLEVRAARDDAAGREDPLTVRADHAACNAGMQTDVVAGRDQEADRSSAGAAAAVPSAAPRGSARRRGRFI